MPKIRQVLVADTLDLAVARMRKARWSAGFIFRASSLSAHEQGEVTGYVCSLSTQTIVYKAMCSGSLLSRSSIRIWQTSEY